MSKSLKPKRVSSLGGLRTPEEVTKNIVSLTETPKPVAKKVVPQEEVVPKKVVPVVKAKVTPKPKPVAKVKKATKTEVVKFIKMEDEHHMVAKISAAKQRISIKAYIEGLVRKDNPDMFK